MVALKDPNVVSSFQSYLTLFEKSVEDPCLHLELVLSEAAGVGWEEVLEEASVEVSAQRQRRPGRR